MSAQPVDVVAVTPEQAEQINAAWRICSGGTRRITGAWVQRFDDSVAAILGFTPPAEFALEVGPGQGGAA